MARKNAFHAFSIGCWGLNTPAVLSLGLGKNREMKNQEGPLTFLLWKSLLIRVCFLSGCIAPSGIPDLNSPDGRVYAKQRAKCHGLPGPRFRTLREWELMVSDMADKIREKGLRPLTMPEREANFRYLERHAKPEKVSNL